MKKKIVTIFLMTIFFVLLLSPIVYAAGIALDGEFDDWSDKPQLSSSPSGSDPTQKFLMIKWYPDTSDGNLYFYAQRSAERYDDMGKKFEDWSFQTIILVNGVQKKLYVYYHPPSQKVDVELYDENGTFVWDASGKWGDDKSDGTRLEFDVPLQYLTKSIVSGYQFDVYFKNDFDRIPEIGYITISTVSTYPIQTTFGVVIISALMYLIFKRRIFKNLLLRSK